MRIPTDGLDVLPELDALSHEIEAALKHGGHDQEFELISESLSQLRPLCANPASATLPEESQPEPQPEIFDAIEASEIARVKKLLKGWDVNQRVRRYDSTALYMAMPNMFGTSLEIMTLLLAEGADPRKGLTETYVLHGLGFGQHDELNPEDLALVIRRCVALGADIEERSEKLKWTPLITAASEWNSIATEALLMGGADINARTGDVPGMCFAGCDAMAFADGDARTLAVLERFKTPN